MRNLLLAALGALALAGAAEAQVDQPNAYESREVTVGPFERIEVTGPFQVAAFVGDGPAQVNLTGPPALLADTIASVEGGTLRVRFRDGARWSWSPGSGVNVSVSVPVLVSASVEGAARLEIVGARAGTFSAATGGSGSIALRGLDAEQVRFATGGSGGITAEGIARDGSYSVGGSGSIDAKRLRIETASLSIGGAGSIHADVSRTANVSIGGSGRVDVVGGAACLTDPADSPRVECR